MIRFANVCKRYPQRGDALQGVSFHLPAGAMAFLTGHSGAGKSTLLKLIALLERATRGQLFVDGENLSRAPKRRIPMVRRKIGMIFQNHHLLFDRTVFDNIALPLVIAGYRHTLLHPVEFLPRHEALAAAGLAGLALPTEAQW